MLLVFFILKPNAAAGVPVPNRRQLEFMDLELTQFMHFGIPTFWDPPKSYLYGANPTYHDCHTTNIDHGPQTEGFYPCLKPDVFNPTDLDAENWMEASAALGAPRGWFRALALEVYPLLRRGVVVEGRQRRCASRVC